MGSEDLATECLARCAWNARCLIIVTMKIASLALIALVACGNSDATPSPAPTPAKAVDKGPAPAAKPGDKDIKKGDQQDNQWIPAEFKTGGARWKDCVVYVDGKPIAFLQWNELPVTLKPTWVKHRVSHDKPYGSKDEIWVWGEQRYYKWTDYLKALHVDIPKIKEMHVLGPRDTNTIVVKASDLLGPKGKDFMFRFGTDIGGKPIPKVPPDFANHRHPDKIQAVLIYIDKAPPKLMLAESPEGKKINLEDDGFVLDGKLVNGVPYWGEPLRGGVRIYLDDRLATIIKRQELDGKKAKQTPDGLAWSLSDFLAAKGVDTSKVVEGWVITDRRSQKIDAKDLFGMSFVASSQASGGIILGDKRIKASALALHTRAIKPEEIDKPRPDEEP
jgi:hypothetical protein